MNANRGSGVPLRFQASCFHCHEYVDIRQEGVYQYVHGWVKARRKGGTNTIALQERTDRYACVNCIDKLKKGLGINQMALFDIAVPDE